MRMRVPGLTCFSTTSVGELKNTIESLSATSTSATASASTPSAAPIKGQASLLAGHRAVPVCAQPSSPSPLTSSSIRRSLFGSLGERAPRIGGGGPRLVALAQHHIGAHQPQPSLDVGAVAVEPLGEPLDHAADHDVALLGR